MAETIHVEVAYATPERAYCIPLQLPAGSNLKQAIEASGLLAQCPQIDLDVNRVGVFGQVCSLETPLGDGDRVEVYRPLEIDPKEARRRRAAARRGD
ncbi:putative ubiquitin-RnfH superfamily antitoxin RatB of RatAB toxin-antitoxin module [Methylohalomonas lacus]|uniref:UPF0125 protein J2T55_001721 n=1 Tax=Methylohalomonas lacus TaxID=398773 RepID=A0AAE3HJZ4_9GAMM|nr:RnfH family protein [Methylohalomonas lacus]MCS3903690.1 putative ubiquitin-RnfH superfamily antitoxin RatB of RatAB toxin-antitoxin module [Methylohalomonas lacus]